MDKTIVLIALLLCGTLLGGLLIASHSEQQMADKGFKKVPVCVAYRSIWVGGGMSESPIRGAYSGK